MGVDFGRFNKFLMIGDRVIAVTLFFVLALGTAKPVVGQIQQLPLVHASEVPSPGKLRPHARQAAEVLDLPFWDDFSADTLNRHLWENRGVNRSASMGINAPSIGVVYFDGVDEVGNPYSRDRLANGEGDRLTSLPINLSTLTPSERQTVFLSFFWQAGGKGEMPDATDQLELQFLNSSGEWIVVWEQSGGYELYPNVFVQEIIQVGEPFLHGAFRFRFQYVGRLSGPYDTWLVDYVYLNKGRQASDLFFEDRALTQLPNSPLGRYAAYPYFWFDASVTQDPVRIAAQFNNLSNRFRAMEYTVTLRDAQTNVLLRELNSNTPLIPVPLARERRDFFSAPFADLDLQPAEGFDLETTVYLSTGDGYKVAQVVGRDTIFEPSVDFRINDTVRTITPLRDFIAYDDGSAEYAAGINQTSGMLAVRFQAPAPAFVTGVSINFTNFLQRGTVVELTVWDSLVRNAVFRQDVVIPEWQAPNEFAYFPLDTNVRIAGNFYVGFTQFTNDFVHVGLDKASDSGSEVFFNVYGNWEQNVTVQGSLMIRPHVSPNPPFPVVPGDAEAAFLLYPNPSNADNVVLLGRADEIRVFDFQGREINVPIESTEQGNLISFVNRQRGLYLVRILSQNRWTSIRLIIK
jgi:hypothetical protein